MTTLMINSDEPVNLSIVIPAYNEANRIGPTIEEYLRYFDTSHGNSYELIVVLNGCTDNTRMVIEPLTSTAPQLRFLEFSLPLGKGGAICEGLAKSRGTLLAFVDADNMVKAPETGRLIHELKKFDVAIASRFGPGSSKSANHPLTRRMASWGVRNWTRLLFGLPFKDTQCGAKAFTSSAWRKIAPHIREHGWAFDLDVLAVATNFGMKVSEVPVEWQHIGEGSKLALWKAGPQLLKSTLRIWWRTRKSPKSQA